MWWIRNDICGMFSAGFTVFLLLYAQLVMITIVILPWYGFSYHILLYTTLTILALISHCRAQFTNPGAIPLDRVPPPGPPATIIDAHGNEVLPPPPRICRRCKVLKPYKAHHCSTCKRCIIRMDHHCPWVNNCVAIFNQKYFLLFLLYTGLCCIYSGTLLVARFISCTNNLKQCTITSSTQVVLCVLNAIEALIFGLFCIIMLWDQLSAIFENTPGIDALQNKKGIQRGRYASLIEVFGEELNYRWWFPFYSLPQKMQHDFKEECEELEDPVQVELRELAEQRAAFEAHGEDSHIIDHHSSHHSHHRQHHQHHRSTSRDAFEDHPNGVDQVTLEDMHRANDEIETICSERSRLNSSGSSADGLQLVFPDAFEPRQAAQCDYEPDTPQTPMISSSPSTHSSAAYRNESMTPKERVKARRTSVSQSKR